MIFQIQKRGIRPYQSSWAPKELELEQYILPSDEDEPLLQESVFGEQLLFLNNQVKTRHAKRADIIALDKAGSLVVVELKRRTGSLGVETQALQYLADLSAWKGMDCVRHFCRPKNTVENLQEKILGFLGGDFKIEDINRRSRIILFAQSFDPSLYSMGEWLSRSGVAFRCIEYTPFEIGKRKFLSFSVAFDRAPDSLYPLAFQNHARRPLFFWHNIGRGEEARWSFWKERGEIGTGFDNQPGDQGERILKSYVAGDTIVAYASGFGAVGWGVIKNPRYRLIQRGDADDRFNGHHLHRLSVEWKAVAPTLQDSIPSDEVKQRFGIYHPVSTSVNIEDRKAQELIATLSEKFPLKHRKAADSA